MVLEVAPLVHDVVVKEADALLVLLSLPVAAAAAVVVRVWSSPEGSEKQSNDSPQNSTLTQYSATSVNELLSSSPTRTQQEAAAVTVINHTLLWQQLLGKAWTHSLTLQELANKTYNVYHKLFIAKVTHKTE